MKSAARAAAGRAAWARKSPAEKARIRARLAAGRQIRDNLNNYETRVIEGILKKSPAQAAVKTPAAQAPAAQAPKAKSKRTPTPAQLAALARGRAKRGQAAAPVPASSKKPRNTRSGKTAPSGPPSAAVTHAKRLAALEKARAARAQNVAARKASGRTGRTAPMGSRQNVSDLERRKLERLLSASNSKKARAAAKRKARARRKADPKAAALHAKRLASLEKARAARKAKKSRSNGARNNMYIPTRANGARKNMYIPTRANGARNNMYIRRNPGMEMVKNALRLTGLGLGGFMVTNVATHYAGRVEFARGAVADFGVPAALTALVWLGPTGRLLSSNRFVGRNGQIALTAGIAGAVINRMLDGIITSNLAKVPAVGGHLSKVLLGWPLISEESLQDPQAPQAPQAQAGVGEYVYDLPDSGMGEYVRDPSRLSVEREMQGLAYVNLEQRAANEAALQAANIPALQPEINNYTSQFDDQFESAY